MKTLVWIVVAIACLGWALMFLGLTGPSIAWLLFDREYWDWTFILLGSGSVLILLCWPFARRLGLT